MKKWQLLIVLLGLLGFSPSLLAQDSMAPEQINKIARSVVLIVAIQDGEPVSFGSGTLVTEDGLIFTNRHVVEGADDFEIYLLDDPNEMPIFSFYARLEQLFPVSVDSVELDFATLQIDRDVNGNAILRTNLDLPALDITKFSPVQRGDRVFVFGYPGIGDGFLVFTDGLITTVQNDTVNASRIPTWYQTNAEIAPGNSGGLAVNAAGFPVGIPTAVQSEDRTGGRLGGILPFNFIETVINSGIQPDVIGRPPGSTSPGTGEAELLIEITGVDWNVNVEGEAEPFVVVHTNIQANGFSGEVLRAGVFFFWDDGGESLPVISENDAFATPTGLLTEQDILTPASSSAEWTDFQFRLPMSALPQPDFDRSGFVVADIGIDGVEFVAPSNRWAFSFTVDSDTTANATTPDDGTARGVNIACPDDGLRVVDGVEIVVDGMLPGFEYVATVIGLDGFDPILAVGFSDETSGVAALCSDDSEFAAQYLVDVPTAPQSAGTTTSAQVPFSHDSDGRQDISLYIGEFNRNPGEFLVVLQGMAVAGNDGRGDPFIFNVSPNVAASSSDLNVYMIGTEVQLDPLMYVLDEISGETLVDNNGDAFRCDDSATSSCWGFSDNLESSSVTTDTGRRIVADSQDAMMSIAFDPTIITEPLPLPFIMTSFNQQSSGRYVVVFHVGVE